MQENTLESIRRFRIPYHVKRQEEVLWCIEEDWITQLNNHLQVYLNNPRSKKKEHVEIARFMHQLTSSAPTDKRQHVEHLIKLCKEVCNPRRDAKGNPVSDPTRELRHFVSERGRNSEPSYLFHLCRIALQQHGNLLLVSEAAARATQSVDQDLRGHKRRADAFEEKNIELGKQMEQLTDKIPVIEKHAEERVKLALGSKARYEGLFNEANRKAENLEVTNQAQRQQLEEKESQVADLQGKLVGEAQLLQEIKKLRNDNERLQNYESSYKEEVIEHNKVKTTNTQLQEELASTTLKLNSVTSELHKLKGVFESFKSWVNDMFGYFLKKKPSELFEENASIDLTEKQKRLVTRIYNATDADLTPEYEASMSDQADKLHTEKTTLEGKFDQGLGTGLNFLSSLSDRAATKLDEIKKSVSSSSLPPIPKSPPTSTP